MAGRGNTTPKPADQRRRANKPPKAREVEYDGEPIGPDLPFGFDWPDQTRIWWDNWRRSIVARTWVATDWDFAMDTAMVHAEFWSGNTSIGPELRLRVAKMGATQEDRARMNIAAVEPEQKTAKPRGQRYSHLKVIGE